jgi:hypothetical protein
MGEKRSGAEEVQPDWAIEIYELPGQKSSAVYRRCGERIQVRATRSLPLAHMDDNHFRTETEAADDVSEFATEFDDSVLMVENTDTPLSNGKTMPSLTLIGWQELDTPEGLRDYDTHKATGRDITQLPPTSQR